MSKLEQFNKERAIWIKNGKPYRSPEQMEIIYNICESCSEFTKGVVMNSCGLCGCRLHKSDRTVPNKIAWATTSCPHEDKKWEAESRYQQLEVSDKEIEEASEEKETDDLHVKAARSVPNRGCGCGQRS